MPILTIEIIGTLPDSVRDGLAQRLADAAGAAFSSRPQGTWVRLRFTAAEDYAENDATGDPGVSPVFVNVRKSSNPEGEALRQEAIALTKAVADACRRPPENIHICYEAAATGRQAFGGKLVE